MSAVSTPRVIYDEILATLEDFAAQNTADIIAWEASLREKLNQIILSGLPSARSRSAQFELVHKAIGESEALFAATVAAVSKEAAMSLARRAPTEFLDGSELLLASLITKHASPDPKASWTVETQQDRGLALDVTEDHLWRAFQLIAIAKSANHLRGMARWLGKGGELVATRGGGLTVDLPGAVRTAVEHYERRRERRWLGAGGFFALEPEPARWSDFRIPSFFRSAGLIEAPLGSGRQLRFERYPMMRDGGGLARLLRGYEEALRETFGTGADAILHALTALAILIDSSSPKLTGHAGRLGTIPAATNDQTEQEIGFAFGLGRKGFLRFTRADLIYHIGRVRTVLAPDQTSGERLASDFLDAFVVPPAGLKWVDVLGARSVPFLHASTNDYVYVDVLLVGDFLAGLLERGKEWYASQHGDRFVLDLKRWLDDVAPGSVIDARRRVPLGRRGAQTDIDLLVQRGQSLWVVECKAYSKSRDFMIGAPRAITHRRGRIRNAAQQAKRTAEAFRRAIAAGNTEFDCDLTVDWLVCSPTTEFLLPFEEHGLIDSSTPRVVTPEELVAFLLRSGD